MKAIKECPFCGKQFTQDQLDDMFMDEKGFVHCPNCGERELEELDKDE